MAPDDAERSYGNVGLRLTYADIAERLHISGDAARQLVRRRGWQRIVPNRCGAETIVIVPEEDLAGERRRDTPLGDNGGTTPDDPEAARIALSGVILPLQEAIVALREQLTASQAHINQAEARAMQAEKAVAAERTRADADRAAMQSRLESAQAELRRALDAAEALHQAEAERKARGALRRAWEAWRGR